MNLSLFNNRTTAAARKRNGQACLALSAGGTYRQERQEWRGNRILRSVSAVSAVSTMSVKPAVLASATVALASFCFDLGGRPSIGTPAPQGLAIGAFRMHAAPLTLDPSANPQEGDA